MDKSALGFIIHVQIKRGTVENHKKGHTRKQTNQSSGSHGVVSFIIGSGGQLNARMERSSTHK